MATKPLKKLIVTNWSALKSKYGAGGVKKIRAALDELVDADRGRALASVVRGLDDKLVPASKRATAKPDAARSKAAVDFWFARESKPDYLLLLGGPRIIPHCTLENPVDDGEDPDEKVPSDLPYSCDEVLGDKIRPFVGPSRAVGRIPDLPGDGDPRALIDLIRAAARHSPATQPFPKVFSVSAEIWKDATRVNLRRVFGANKPFEIAPTAGPPWSKPALQPTLHFINCHGAESDSQFYGDDDVDQPIAIRSTDLKGKVTRATVIAAECCYGAELYDATGMEPGMCITYLREGALAFVGSTNVAYGASTTRISEADVLCAHFAKLVREGASLGRAMLEARLKFVEEVSPLNPFELKTLGQFLLLGDPSLRAVAKRGVPGSAPKSSRKGGLRAGILDARTESGTATLTAAAQTKHQQHRKALDHDATRLQRSTQAVRVDPRSLPPSETRSTLEKLAHEHRIDAVRFHACAAEGTARGGTSAKGLRRAKTVADQFFVAFAKSKPGRDRTGKRPRSPRGARRAVAAKSAGIVRIEALVARIRAGKVIAARRVVSR